MAGASVLVDSSKHAALAYCLRFAPRIDLRVVHVVRDSRGVAYSWTKRVARPEADGEAEMTRYTPGRSALLWNAHNAAFAMLRRRGVPVRRLRYEDLLADPRGRPARSGGVRRPSGRLRSTSSATGSPNSARVTARPATRCASRSARCRCATTTPGVRCPTDRPAPTGRCAHRATAPGVRLSGTGIENGADGVAQRRLALGRGGHPHAQPAGTARAHRRRRCSPRTIPARSASSSSSTSRRPTRRSAAAANARVDGPAQPAYARPGRRPQHRHRGAGHRAGRVLRRRRPVGAGQAAPAGRTRCDSRAGRRDGDLGDRGRVRGAHHAPAGRRDP